MAAAFLPSKGEVPQWEDEEDVEEDNIKLFEGIESEIPCKKDATGFFSSLANIGGLLDAITGNRVMNQGTLDPVLNKIKQLLISKNVAVEVSVDDCRRLVSSIYTCGGIDGFVSYHNQLFFLT